MIIGKYTSLPRDTNEKNKYLDKSTVYKSDETAIVHQVIHDRNEESRSFIKIALRKVRGVVIGDKFCLTADHEVLTEDGWVRLDKLDKDMKICTINSDGEMVYSEPTVIHKSYYEGGMYNIINNKINTVCTPQHKMYIREKDESYKLDEIQNIIGKELYWKKNCINTFKRNNEMSDSYLKFLGVFITHGAIDKKGRVIIYVFDTKIRKLIESVEDDLRLKRIEHKIGWYCYDTEILLSKNLPDCIWNLSQKQSRLLLKSIIKNDIYIDGFGWEFRTGYKRLADDVQRLSIHCGWTTKINEKSTGYQLYISKDDNEPLLKVDKNIINYKGMVYCPEVDNSVFMVRYKGTPYFTGNSSRAG